MLDNVILISIILIIFNYGFILLAFKLFGRVGLFISIPITIILANLQVGVQISMLGMALTLGNVAYASSYLITDLLGELYSKRDARYGVYLGFFTLIFVTVIMNIILLYQPSAETQQFYDSLYTIFKFLPRIAIASMISYMVSQSLDVVIFHKLKVRHQDKKLWIRNNISTLTSQLLDNFIFTFLAFTGVFSFDIVLQIFITTYLVKLVISLIDTPFMYLGVYLKKHKYINEVDVS